jgi:ataxia telangiectasia mutated family protein
MLNVVQFIRTQEHGLKGAPRPSQLNLNFLHVAQAAQFCSAYFTSLLYAELWGTEQKTRIDNPSAGFRTIDEICDNSDDGKALHTILLQGYKKIGDPDALYGCGMSRLLDSQSRIWYYEHCNQWDKVMLMHDIIPNQPKGVISRGAALALQQSGLNHMLESYLQHQQTEEMKALQYECCWRLGRWDLPTTAEAGRDYIKWTVETSTAYEAYHYSALKSLYTSDVTSLDIDITNSRNCITQSLIHANLESSKNIYSALSQLQTLQELEDFSQILRRVPEESGHQNKNILSKVLRKWKDQDEITCNHFQYCEPILSQRIALLGIACERQDSQEVLHAELHDGTLVNATSKLLLQLAQAARNEQWFHVSEKALRHLTKLQDPDEELTSCWKLEDSRNLWDQGNKDMGRHSLLSLITSLNESDLETQAAIKLQAEALGLYGTWLVDSR